MKNDNLTTQDLLAIVTNRLQEITFIFVIALILFLLLALGSYNYLDPGWSHTGVNIKITNAAGIAGAYIADLTLSLFGYLGYFLPVVVAGIFATLYRGLDITTYVLMFLLKTIGGIVFLVSGCGILNLYVPIIGKVIPHTSGGIIGSFVEYYAVIWLGKEGSTLLLAATFMVGISLTLNISWKQIIHALDKFLLALAKITKYVLYVVVRLFKKILKPQTLIRMCKKVNNVLIKGLSSIYDKGKQKVQFSFISKKLSKAIIVNAEIKPDIGILQKNNDTSFKVNKPESTIVSASMELKPDTINNSNKQISEDNSITNLNTLPEVGLLEQSKPNIDTKHLSKANLKVLSSQVEKRLLEFGADVNVVAVYPGPVITRFELSLKPGLKVSKISSLAKDLARSLSVSSVRVVEVIPGKAVIGLEIPNEQREIVKLREIIESKAYEEFSSPVTLALGKDIAGQPIITDLAKMPHLLVAGTTGSGKSVGVNAMLLSMLYKSTPENLRLILIDPKMLELSIYEGIPHLLAPVVTDMKDAANALRWCVYEMERRYQLMAAVGVRNLDGYNSKIELARENGSPLVDPLWSPVADQSAPLLTNLPRVVVIIDEFADMIMVVGKKVEELIARIAQKARAAGIHMILATQRPSVDVITGLIKANIPTRISFQVSSKIDSRTVLDQQGAEQLLGHGDMLFLPPGRGIPTRVHGAFVSDQEVHDVVGSLKKMGRPNYEDSIKLSNTSILPSSFVNTETLPLPGMRANFDGISNTSGGGSFSADMEDQDELFEQAVQIVTETKKTSVSNLQRRLKIGYNRAARLVENMEAKGILSPMQSNGMREILMGTAKE